MRHLKNFRKLGVSGSHRKAMLRNMVDSLVLHGRIKTTVTRAKELRRIADRLITLAKKDTLHSRRLALRILRTKQAFYKLFSEYKEKFKDRNGGYTRIVRLGFRDGDNAPLAYIEYLQDELQSKVSGTRRRRRRKKAKSQDNVASDNTNNTTSQAQANQGENVEKVEASSASTEANENLQKVQESQELISKENKAEESQSNAVDKNSENNSGAN